MEVLLRRHGGDGGATAILARCHGGHGGAAATPLRIVPTRGGTSEVLNMLKVSAGPPQRSAVLTVFGGATAINDATTAEPRRSWRCHCDLYRTSTAVAPRLRCDGGSTADARRNMLKVSAVPPRRSAVLTVFGGATAINDGTTAEPWRCHCGLCRTSTAVAPRLRCDGGIMLVLKILLYVLRLFFNVSYSLEAGLVNLIILYRLSLNLIDRSNPLVIHYDFFMFVFVEFHKFTCHVSGFGFFKSLAVIAHILYNRNMTLRDTFYPETPRYQFTGYRSYAFSKSTRTM